MATIEYRGKNWNAEKRYEPSSIANILYKGADAVERKISDRLAENSAFKPVGTLIPFESFTRDLTTAGTYQVGEGVDTSNFFGALTAKSTVLKAGAKTVIYPFGNQNITGLESPAIIKWVTENERLTEVPDPVFRAVAMSPKMCSISIKIGRQLMVQSSFELDRVIKAEITRALSLEIDRVCLNGLSASNEPMGLMNCSDIVTDTTAEMSYANIVDMAGNIDDLNANINGLSLITTPLVKRDMLKTFRNPNSGDTPVWCGIPDMKFLATKNMPLNGAFHSAIMGDFSNLVIGFWGQMIDIIVDNYTYSSESATRIVGRTMIDIGIIHPESFRKTNTIALI